MDRTFCRHCMYIVKYAKFCIQYFLFGKCVTDFLETLNTLGSKSSSMNRIAEVHHHKTISDRHTDNRTDNNKNIAIK